MNAIELPDGIKVTLKEKYNPNKRLALQKIIVSAGTEDVEAAYNAIEVFIDKVYKDDKSGTEPKDLGFDYLLEEVDYMVFVDNVVPAVLEIIQHDKGMHKAIGMAFGIIQPTDEELELIQKKMAAQNK